MQGGGGGGEMLNGVFRFSGLSYETILFRSIYGDYGIFGNIARISSTFVFMFTPFGGLGLVVVCASGLTETISGSAVANTASTGITITLMKKVGFDGKFATWVEAASRQPEMKLNLHNQLQYKI
ncbi:MAG: TRAP-type uncharacterized transport system fused permease subunit [Desulforhopalus sp.]|jgi:TRAP-type uncharacterized transport system fused permease subunit